MRQAGPPHGHRVASRTTRGKTAPNRLRRTDLWVLLEPPAALQAPSPLVVDLGFGADATTTLETAARLAPYVPNLRVVGVESDPARVAAALPHERPGVVEFRRGGFTLPLRPGDTPAVIRAMNVLRQYDEADHRAATRSLRTQLAPGGVLVEGTSSPTGALAVFHVRTRTPHDDVVVFAPNLRRLCAAGAPVRFLPSALRAVLPKDLVHHAGPGTALDAFFAAWDRAWMVVSSAPVPPPVALAASVHRLRADGFAVRATPHLLRHGFVALRSTTGTAV